MVEIRPLTAPEALQNLAALAGILLDCVQGGASVSFMSNLTRSEAEAFFKDVIESVRNSGRILLAAFVDSELVGTVQILTAMPPNQPHRADVSKLLVHRSARGQGIGRQLMEEVERVSLHAGKTLLVLDTATGDHAERLYVRLGWTKLGAIPNYAQYPDGAWTATTFFYKHLDGGAAQA